MPKKKLFRIRTKKEYVKPLVHVITVYNISAFLYYPLRLRFRGF